MHTNNKILIVDDDANLRQTLCEILTAKGYCPIAVARGNTALEKIKQDKPIVALIDLKLVDISGMEVLKEIKKTSPYTKCIVLTGYASQKSAIESINLGVYSYVKKPYDIESLLLTIHRAIEKKETETALRESEARYRLLVENIRLGITLIDADHNIIMTNTAQGNFFHKTASELAGKKCFNEFEKRDEVCDHCPGTKAMITGKTQEADTEGVLDDGTRISARIHAFPLADADGTARGFIEVVEDVTERRKAEEEIKRLNEVLEQRVIERTAELETVNKELNNFAYVASHDLKAPLRAISQLSYWLSEDYTDKLDEAGKETLDLLIGRVKRMYGLIDGILEYSRVGRTKEEKKQVNINDVVREAISMISPPKNINITIENDLPVILCEGTRISQVFQNLLSNAVKFVDKPMGEIIVGCVDDGTNWRFSVTDNGPGIEKRNHEKIFNIFQTLKPRDEQENTGIGLTIVKKIIELYDGKIWVESEMGRGSTFFFTLPKLESMANEKPQANSSR